MRTRSAVILIENAKVALIKRSSHGESYFLFPGGGVLEGETPAQAAAREALEELGLSVRIIGVVAIGQYETGRQIFD
jgi:8-oxo-dGTP pyrophosphatase MutT (NUDIX family)